MQLDRKYVYGWEKSNKNILTAWIAVSHIKHALNYAWLFQIQLLIRVLSGSSSSI